jgi:hypothetical protein
MHNSHEPGEPLFARRIPLTELILKERQFAMEAAHRGVYQWLTHYHQMMVLEAAIAGVVIPILYSQGPGLVNPWFLRRALLWFGVSLFVGVLIVSVSKWVTVFIIARLQRQYARQDEAIAAGVDESEALAAVNEAFRPEARRLQLLTYTTGILGDAVFYGGFLGGLYCLLQGLVQGQG